MSVYEIHALDDPRWNALVDSHPRSSVFHSSQWLDALRRTYGYEPLVLTRDPAGVPLTGGILFCQIRSWITGPRLVSVPYSDHCEPLVNGHDLSLLISGIQEAQHGKFKYLEIRPRSLEFPEKTAFRPDTQHSLHVVDLSHSLDDLYRRLHKDSVRRKIRRAERENVVLLKGRSEELLSQFYRLLVLTRRRHALPPQPLAWFRNLVECFGDRLIIRVASSNGEAIASIMTLRHKQSVVYKYGGSDARFHPLGAMPYLFWDAIRDARLDNCLEFDLGRSDRSNTGLIRFKDNLGGHRTDLKYWRLSHDAPGLSTRILKSGWSQKLMLYLPESLLRLAGSIAYRHGG